MRTRSTAMLVFAFVGIVWGSNFIFMKWAVELISPMQVVLVRVFFGFILVLAYALLSNSLKLSHLKHWPHYLVMSLLATVIYYFSFVKATSLLPSGIAGSISSTIPLTSFLLAAFFLSDENINIKKFAGVVMGFIGVLTITDPFQSGITPSVQGVLYMVAGSVCVGASFVYAKKFLADKNIPAQALTTYQLGFAFILLCLITDFKHITYIYSDIPVFLATTIGLGFLGTGFAFISYYYLVQKLGAVKAATSTYLPPIVALIIGSFIGEEIFFWDYAGALLIIVGVVLLNLSKSQNR